MCVCVTCATHPLLPSPLAVAGLPFNAQPKKGVKFNSKEDSGNTEKLAQVQTYSTYQCYSVAMVMLPGVHCHGVHWHADIHMRKVS